jgi:hypothetical protein
VRRPATGAPERRPLARRYALKMHPTVFNLYDSLVTTHAKRPQSVLEIGAVPRPDTLLCLPAVASASERIGVNIETATEFAGFRILSCTANSLDCFDAERFDVVLCNATLEHDPLFWKTLDEIRRVLKKMGVAVIGVPGYVRLPAEGYKSVIRSALRRLPNGARLTLALGAILNPTITFEVHYGPGDYYRFSEQAVRDVFFRGMERLELKTLMVPPRIVGAARELA